MQALGIDISDGHISAVVLEQQRNALTLRACPCVSIIEGQDPVDCLPALFGHLDWQGGVAVCGLPLALLSVRNLSLPFKESHKIAQVLPLELEEQMLTPADALITDHLVAGKNESGALVLAFSLAREFQTRLLAGLAPLCDPDIVTPALLPLAAQLARLTKERSNFLLVHADLHASSMALVDRGSTVFCRRLSHPEQMILHPPFAVNRGEAGIADPGAAEECVRLLARSIVQSLDFFRMEYGDRPQPERVLLAGPLANVAIVAEIFYTELGLPVEVVDQLAAHSIFCPDEVRPQWRARSSDLALALALQGLRKPEINFRKGAFAKPRSLLAAGKGMWGLAAAGAALVLLGLGFLGYEYQRLQGRDAELNREMTAVYTRTFPEVTKVRDPYTEMQVRLKAAQGPASPSSSLYGNQRILSLLAEISTRIPETVNVRVTRLSIDRDLMAIKGTTETYNAVETIKSALAASPKFKTVQIISATADKDKKSAGVRFEVQLQLEGL